MLKIGGNSFENCTIPLVIENQYFVVSNDEIPLISVFFVNDGKLIFELRENNPVENPFTNVTKFPNGFIVVADKETDLFLFKIRPSSDTSIVFGTIEQNGLSIIINDKLIIINGNKFERNTFVDIPVGIIIKSNLNISVGCQFPSELSSLISNDS